MNLWQPTAEQSAQWERDGYFIERGVLSRDEAMQIKGAILNFVLTPELGQMRQDELDPMDPMDGASPRARTARLRKLGRFGQQSPLLWHLFYAGENVLARARHFVGDDIAVKFNSCFLKPAHTGSATPWHQDNGLWRDGDQSSFNIWMAVDPATRENGCMQFVPGSHSGEIIPHIMYPDSLHGELPRDLVAKTIAEKGVQHIELQPGDAVCWHSNLWHFSPPNTSAKGRIAVAGVYSAAEEARRNPHFRGHLLALRCGEIVTDFPPQPLDGYATEHRSAQPYAAAY